jgi:Protein of unknown function (DUF3604)
LTQLCIEANEELMMNRLFAISGAALANAFAASLFATAVAAQDVITDIGTLDKETAEKAFPAKPPYSPYAGRNFPTRPYFGDTHTHTSYSMDAGAFGARLGPKNAYRFAKGEEVIASSGQRAKLSRPLDFLARSSALSQERAIDACCRSLTTAGGLGPASSV